MNVEAKEIVPSEWANAHADRVVRRMRRQRRLRRFISVALVSLAVAAATASAASAMYSGGHDEEKTQTG
jgi:hypothetical protein